MADAKLQQITDRLVEFGKTIPVDDLFPALNKDATELAIKNPYAFCIATCLDRGTKAEIIWTIPYDIAQVLEHLDPYKIAQMDLDHLSELFKKIQHKPRYTNDAPRTLMELTKKIIRDYNGDATLIWQGKCASEVKKTFDSIFGVGPSIANMAVLLIEKAYPIKFLDRYNMDIKPDVHTKRVLFRLGASYDESEDSALAASREMNPEFPGIVDSALWYIGRKWCFSTDPDCQQCPVDSVCEKKASPK